MWFFEWVKIPIPNSRGNWEFELRDQLDYYAYPKPEKVAEHPQ